MRYLVGVVLLTSSAGCELYFDGHHGRFHGETEDAGMPRPDASDADAALDSGIVTAPDASVMSDGPVDASSPSSWSVAPIPSASGVGISVALSADGSTLALGAPYEDGDGTGVNPGPSTGVRHFSGAAFVFVRNGDSWTQQAYIKPFNTAADEQFGYSVALSADGNTLAVGALGESSDAAGIDGVSTGGTMPHAGAAFTFARLGDQWTPAAYIKAANPTAGALFGNAISLSGDGTVLAVGAYTSTLSTQPETFQSGAVYMFARPSGFWVQQRELVEEQPGATHLFGYSLGLSSNGTTVVVGAFNAGTVTVFSSANGTWNPKQILRTGDGTSGAALGASVALSADGTTLIAGTCCKTTPLFPNGAFVFDRASEVWTQTAELTDPSWPGGAGVFGSAVSVSADGDKLAVGDVNDGLIYAYGRSTGSGPGWSRVLGAVGDAPSDLGYSIAVSADGSTVAAGDYEHSYVRVYKLK